MLRNSHKSRIFEHHKCLSIKGTMEAAFLENMLGLAKARAYQLLRA
jgi:hypothetical protein